jgi:Ca2+-binding RTX toxin-like protein
MRTRAKTPKLILQPLGFGVTLPLALAACGGSGGSGGGTSVPPTPPPPPLPPPPPAQTVQGTVFDGPIEGATVFRDENGNGVQDNDEPFAVSDANGQFEIVEGTGDLVSLGGVDTVSGFRFAGELFSAPSGSRIISPLTTLLNAATDADAFQADTGLDNLRDFDANFDVLDYSPFDANNTGQDQLNELLLFLTQASLISTSFVRAVAEVAGIDQPYEYALELVANNVVPLGADAIGLVLQDTVFSELADALVTADVPGVDGFSAAVVADELERLLTVYAVALAENEQPADSVQVQSILQEALSTLEGQIFDLLDPDLALTRDPNELFPSDDALELEIGRTNDLVNSVEGAVAIAARAGGTLSGGEQGDFLRGRSGDDVINGSGGNDIIIGGRGNDSLNGDGGDDIIIKRDGTGTIEAGPGNDEISIGFTTVNVDGGEGQDRLVLGFASPVSAAEDNKTPYSLDVEGDGLTLEIGGVTVLSASVSGVEEYLFANNADIQFTGSAASESLNAQTSDIRVFVSGGNDQISNPGVSTTIADFSKQSAGVSISSPMPGDNDLEYGFGSLEVSGGIDRVIGSDFGDEIFSRRFPFEVQLGAGQDTVFIEQQTLFRVSGFSKDGQVDILDFSSLDGADMFLLEFNDVISRFQEINEFAEGGEIITSLQFSYSEDDGFNPISFVLEGLSFADIGPENIVLPGDVV